MSFPNMMDGIVGFADAVTFTRVKKTATDGEIVETPDFVQHDVSFQAVVEPMPAQRLMIKPEGQRTWKWVMMWTGKKLELNDVVVDRDGKSYRVMGVSDWSRAGYYAYELTQAFGGAGGIS